MIFVCILILGMSRSSVAKETYQLEEGEWQKQTTLDRSTPEGQLQRIRTLLAEGRTKRARKLADQWIEQYANHHLVAEAYLVRGDAWVAQKHYYKALYDYEYLARGYPASEHFLKALEREFEIARLFDGGVKRRLLGMRVIPAGSEAEELYLRIQERAPGSEIGMKASLALANRYFRKAEMTSAATAYELFLRNYPNSQHREQAMLRVIQANLATFKGPKFDPTGLIEAGERLKAYRNQFPAAAERIGVDTLLVRIEESLALKGYYRSQWYDRQGRTVSSVYTYRSVIRDYPRTTAAKLAIQQLARLGEPVVVQTNSPETIGEPVDLSPSNDGYELDADQEGSK